jgi:hypothetical protein
LTSGAAPKSAAGGRVGKPADEKKHLARKRHNQPRSPRNPLRRTMMLQYLMRRYLLRQTRSSKDISKRSRPRLKMTRTKV